MDTRKAFEEWWAGGIERRHETYPAEYVRDAEERAAWEAWQEQADREAIRLNARPRTGWC